MIYFLLKYLVHFHLFSFCLEDEEADYGNDDLHERDKDLIYKNLLMFITNKQRRNNINRTINAKTINPKRFKFKNHLLIRN